MAGAEWGPKPELARLGIVRAELIEKIRAWKEPLTQNEKDFIRLGLAVCGADKAAKKRKRDSVREAQREEKIVNMDEKRLAEDEAKLEAQRPGVLNDVKLWQVLDGQAMRGKLNYPSAELRNALKAQGKSDRTRALPQLVLAVKDAYGWAS